MQRRRARWVGLIGIGTTMGLVLGGMPATAAPSTDIGNPLLPRLLTRAVKVENTDRHLRSFQRIADQNGGTRAANTPGYTDSVRYVAGQLRRAGFDVTTPSFTYEEQVVDAETWTVSGVEYEVLTFEYSPETPEGGISGPLAVVPEDETTGCEDSDFATQDYTGTIALIRRGGCFFVDKQLNAAEAGAIGVVISNNVDGDVPVNGTLGAPEDGVIPTAGATQNDGDALRDATGEPSTLDLRYTLVERTSYNVIAQTTTGRTNNVVMAGAHLDSVPEGPGINDNGTGSAGLLEIALQLGGSPRITNAVRFAWWGAEELGLIGSTAYVDGLNPEEQLDIALYLNFDMIGSPNAGYFVYDGDDSAMSGAGPGPAGSDVIEQDLRDYLLSIGVEAEDTDFSGRSDYGPFIAIGIPSGGLFTGAEGIKTAEQAAKWGGQADVAYDPCYHQACDTLVNPNRTALDRNSDTAAWVIGRYALSTRDITGGRTAVTAAGPLRAGSLDRAAA